MASMYTIIVRGCRFRLEYSARTRFGRWFCRCPTIIERAQPVLPISVGFECGDYMVPMSN